ncbi:MAG: hypothetical protein AAF963_02515, partial [Bacteroidota bacterium]
MEEVKKVQQKRSDYRSKLQKQVHTALTKLLADAEDRNKPAAIEILRSLTATELDVEHFDEAMDTWYYYNQLKEKNLEQADNILSQLPANPQVQDLKKVRQALMQATGMSPREIKDKEAYAGNVRYWFTIKNPLEVIFKPISMYTWWRKIINPENLDEVEAIIKNITKQKEGIQKLFKKVGKKAFDESVAQAAREILQQALESNKEQKNRAQISALTSVLEQEHLFKRYLNEKYIPTYIDPSQEAQKYHRDRAQENSQKKLGLNNIQDYKKLLQYLDTIEEDVTVLEVSTITNAQEKENGLKDYYIKL